MDSGSSHRIGHSRDKPLHDGQSSSSEASTSIGSKISKILLPRCKSQSKNAHRPPSPGARSSNTPKDYTQSILKKLASVLEVLSLKEPSSQALHENDGTTRSQQSPRDFQPASKGLSETQPTASKGNLGSENLPAPGLSKNFTKGKALATHKKANSGERPVPNCTASHSTDTLPRLHSIAEIGKGTTTSSTMTAPVFRIPQWDSNPTTSQQAEQYSLAPFEQPSNDTQRQSVTTPTVANVSPPLRPMSSDISPRTLRRSFSTDIERLPKPIPPKAPLGPGVFSSSGSVKVINHGTNILAPPSTSFSHRGSTPSSAEVKASLQGPPSILKNTQNDPSSLRLPIPLRRVHTPIPESSPRRIAGERKEQSVQVGEHSARRGSATSASPKRNRFWIFRG